MFLYLCLVWFQVLNSDFIYLFIYFFGSGLQGLAHILYCYVFYISHRQNFICGVNWLAQMSSD